jgi:hypothetical protein
MPAHTDSGRIPISEQHFAAMCAPDEAPAEISTGELFFSLFGAHKRAMWKAACTKGHYSGGWFAPDMRGFFPQCCKCGSVHKVDFRIVKSSLVDGKLVRRVMTAADGHYSVECDVNDHGLTRKEYGPADFQGDAKQERIEEEAGRLLEDHKRRVARLQGRA